MHGSNSDENKRQQRSGIPDWSNIQKLFIQGSAFKPQCAAYDILDLLSLRRCRSVDGHLQLPTDVVATFSLTAVTMIAERLGDVVALVQLQRILGEFGAANVALTVIVIALVALAIDYARMLWLHFKMVRTHEERLQSDDFLRHPIAC